MSLRNDIERAVESGQGIESLNIPQEHLGKAQEYARLHALRIKQSDTSLTQPTMAGAEARVEETRAEDALLDIQHINTQLQGGGIKDAPEIGFSTGRILSEYENDDDIAKFLVDIIPRNAKPIKITTRKGDPVWGYQKKGENNFYRLTPNSLMESPLSTLGSLSAHPMEALGSMVGALGGGGWVRKMVQEGLGAATGRAVDEFIERHKGATDTTPEIVGEAAQSGAISAALSPVLSAGEAAKKVSGLKGAVSELDKVAQSAEDIAARSGTEPFRPTLADRPDASPIMKRAVGIFNSLFGAGARNKEKAVRSSQLALDKEFRQAAADGSLPVRPDGTIDWDNVITDLSDEQSLKIVGKMRDDLIAVTDKKLSKQGITSKVDPLKRASQYELAVDNYSRASKAQVDQLYNQAFDLADAAALSGGRPVEFQLQRLKGVLDDVESVEVVGKSGELRKWGLDDIDPKVGSLLAQLKDLAANQSFYDRRISLKPKAGIESVSRELKETRYRQASKVLGNLKSIRSQLGDLANPDKDTGSHTISSRIASKAYAALSDTLSNPVGGTPEMQSVWKSANKAHLDRMQVLDFMDAGKILDQSDLGAAEKSLDSLYSNIANGRVGSLKLIDTLSSKLSPTEMGEIRSGYVDSLMKNPNALYRRKWNNVEKRIINTDTRRLLEMHGLRMRRIDKNELVKAIEQTEEGGNRVKQLILRTKPERLKQTLSTAGIPVESYQATIFSDILARISDEQAGNLVINPSSFNAVMRDLKGPKKNEIFELLSPAQQKLLSDVDRLSSFVTTADNIATSLTSMTIVEKMTSPNPVRFAAGAAEASKYWLIGKAASNPSILRVVDKLGTQATPMKKTRAAILASAQLLDDLTGASSELPQAKQQRSYQ